MTLPKYVQSISGNLYFRRTFRSGGKSRTTRHALPPLTDPMFAVRYQELLRGPKPTERDERSIAHLIYLYRISQDYRSLAPTTRATRDMYLRLIEDEHGEKAYAALTPGKVEQLRDEMGDTPGKANNFVATLSLLFSRAIKLKLVGVNPCTGLKRLKIGEHQPWPADVIQKAMDVASPMTRLAIALHLYTGQRISDVCRMEWSHVKDNTIRVVQQKTGKEVWIRRPAPSAAVTGPLADCSRFTRARPSMRTGNGGQCLRSLPPKKPNYRRIPMPTDLTDRIAAGQGDDAEVLR